MQAKILIIAVLVNIYTATAFPQEVLKNRNSYAAGRFYTDKPAELKSQLQQLFSGSIKMKSENTPLAIIVPHAGYIYSGETAASAYNQIDPNRKFERIFIIGSSHTMAFTGASVYCTGHYVTPLGIVKVDLELVNQLAKENKLIKCTLNHIWKSIASRCNSRFCNTIYEPISKLCPLLLVLQRLKLLKNWPLF